MMEVNACHQFGQRHSSIYLILCSAEERNSYSFGTIFILGTQDVKSALEWSQRAYQTAHTEASCHSATV